MGSHVVYGQNRNMSDTTRPFRERSSCGEEEPCTEITVNCLVRLKTLQL
jgi:hypothetical protein